MELPRLPERPRKYADVYVWTFVNLAETMPHPVSPMGWSLMETGIRRFLRPLRLGNDAGYRTFEFLYGRVYWNLTPAFGSRLAFAWLDRNLEMIGPSIRPTLRRLLDSRRVRPRPIFSIPQKLILALQVAMILPWIGLQVAAAAFRPAAVERGLERLEAMARRAPAPTPDWRAAVFHLERYLDRCFLEMKRRFGIAGLLVIVITGSFVGLAKLLMKSRGLAESVDLLTPQRPSKTTEADLALWTAAREGKEAFLAALERFGHRCPGEQDAYSPRPWDDPERAWSRAQATGDPVARYQQRTRERRVDVDARMKALGFLRRMIARPLQRAASRYLPFREDGKHYLMLILGHARRRLVEIGRGLRNEGLVADADDVFFLTLPELAGLARGRGIGDRIAARRAEFEKYRGVKPPLVVTSEGIPEAPRIPLRGDPVSPGIATGRVRVVLDPMSDGLEPGEILVAPHTDPGWTPLFLKAGGLVTEVGGTLSHGAVVAREFGLPAIVNVAGATNDLKTGERIEIDGGTGRIRRLP